MDQGRGPEDMEASRDGDSSSGKRKMAVREPESPPQGQISHDMDSASTPFAKKERHYYDDDTMGPHDSPALYPKHVIVPSSERREESHGGTRPEDFFPNVKEEEGAPVLTPESMGGRRETDHSDVSIDPRQQPYYQSELFHSSSVPYQPVMDHGDTYGNKHLSQHRSNDAVMVPTANANDANDGFVRPRRWACDYCNVATFLSYEEACAHEEACSRRHQNDFGYYGGQRAHHRPPTSTYSNHASPDSRYHHSHPPPPGNGLGALYHASQEVVTPPTPHRLHQSHGHPGSGSHWNTSSSSTRGPSIPVLPQDQGYYRQGYYDVRDDPARYHHTSPPSHHHHHPIDPFTHHSPPPANPHYYDSHQPYSPSYEAPHYSSQRSDQMIPHYETNYNRRILLAMSTDTDSLSDRQCYVRSEMVEIFSASDKEVSARHSKGAQKLVMGQVGIRCVFCSHLRSRDRAERAVCYPSSISRIYQTVADMQRFHFEQCREIPDQIHQVYKKLKTTRPRGVGSPQTYWVDSAKALGLIDTENGIRFEHEFLKEQQERRQKKHHPPPQSASQPGIGSDMSVASTL
jgi:hypothetical protein